MAAMGLRKRFLVVVVGVPGSPAEAQRSEVGRFRSMGAAEQAGQDEWRRILFVHAPHVERYRIVIEDDGVEVAAVPMPELPADTAPGILDETVTPLGASIGALGEPIEEQPEVEEEVAVEEVAVEEVVVTEADEAPAPATDAAATPDAPAPPSAPEAVVVAAAVVADDVSAPEAIEATGELEVIADDELAATGEHKGLADEVADEVADEAGTDDVSATGEVPVIAPDADDAPAPLAPRPYIEIEEPPDGPVPEDVIARFAAMVEADQERAARRAERERGDAG